MSTQLHIHQFKTRYCLSSETYDSRFRLDRVMSTVMDSALDEAINEIGISENEELCIRELHNLVHIPLHQTDSQIAKQLSRALALAIRDRIAGADSQQVVRFASRLHALVDFSTGLVYNQMQRAWAWRQLGFIDDETELTRTTATQQLLASLQAEPELIMPLFIYLSRDNRLLALMKQLQTEHWLILSQALAGKLISRSDSLSGHRVDWQIPSQKQLQAAQTQLQKSRIAQIVIASPHSFLEADVPLSSLIVFIAAEIDCAVFSRTQHWLTEWLRLLGYCIVQAQADLRILAGNWLPDIPLDSTLKQSQYKQSQYKRDLSDDPADSESNLTATDNRTRTEKQRINEIDHSISATVSTDNQEELFSKVPEWNQPELLHTDWGGIFLLYSLMDQLELPQQMMNDKLLCEHSFGWMLYHFACILLSNRDDASSLLFAGAIPGESLFWEDEIDPDQQQLKALQSHSNFLISSLYERLEWQGEAQDMLEWFCYRSASLRIEPAWMSVIYSLDIVDTRIRKAMLDLNPGYLPWLGRVVEIVYE